MDDSVHVLSTECELIQKQSRIEVRELFPHLDPLDLPVFLDQ
jgi:hypothetical protein